MNPCKGQVLQLPEGGYNKLYILVAATEDATGVFRTGNMSINLNIAAWSGFIGQRYQRKFDLDGATVIGMKEPFVKNDNIAWFSSHTHFGYPTRNEPYNYCYIFKYELNLQPQSSTLTLPDNDQIKIFALTVAKENSDDIILLQPLSDDFKENGRFKLRSTAR